MTCPRCGYPQVCGCESCKPRIPELIKPYIPTPDGEGYICANCGLTAGADEWLTWEGDECFRSENPHFDHIVAVARAQIVEQKERLEKILEEKER